MGNIIKKIFTILGIVFFVTLNIFSSIKNFYHDISTIFKQYYVGFEIEFQRENYFYSYPYREIYYPGIQNLGNYQYLGVYNGIDTLSYSYSFRPNPRLSLVYKSKKTLPYTKSVSGNYYTKESTNSELKLEYQLSPKYIFYFNTIRKLSTSRLDYTTKPPQTTFDYWKIVTNDGIIDGTEYYIGTKTIQEWGYADLSLFYGEEYTTFYNQIFDQEAKKSYWQYVDKIPNNFYGVTTSYNFNPSQKLMISGNIDYTYKTQLEYDILTKRQIISYPISFKYRIEDIWEFTLALDNNYSMLRRSIYNKETVTSYEQWNSVKEDSSHKENSIEFSVNRYFKYTGMSVKLGAYNKSIYDAYWYQDDILSSDEKGSIWKYWDQNRIQQGVIFEFVMRPIANKLFLKTTLDYSPWQSYRTSDVSYQESQKVTYSFNAFYRPTEMFEISAKRDSTINSVDSYPTMIPVLNTPDLWKITKENNFVLSDVTTIGLTFRYIWGSFTFSLINVDKTEVYFYRDEIFLQDKKFHPWRYADNNTNYFNYRYSFFVQPTSQITISGEWFSIPTFVALNKNSYYYTYGMQGYNLYVKYDFSPLFSVSGSVTQQDINEFTRNILLYESGSFTSDTDSITRMTVVSLKLKYRI